ncbi:MAG: hypothetical protein JNG84_12435, partial [Archangium sp.]|nr:hypothetical protein [Archangium sp.]
AGSLLAVKGARATSAFNVKLDDAVQVEGTAILASSGADELSQEARALGGSVFTHHLVSGLRGAADDDGNGRVTVDEAYSYAAARTTLETAGSEAGAQRPVFRYELKGRGEVVLTQVRGPGSVVTFPRESTRCFVTDERERALVAEVPGGAATRLTLPVGAFIVKCPQPDGYRMASLVSAPGGAVDAAALAYRTFPLSAGVLKGGPGLVSVDPLASLKRDGFSALEQGRPRDAMELFNRALDKDLRDAEAYRGKAQAYLALANDASWRGDSAEVERLRTAAVRTDPRLADDPQFREAMRPPEPPRVQTPRELKRENLEAADPRKYQTVGVGLSLFDPHGPLNLSFTWSAREWLQLSAHLSPFVLGLGLTARALPLPGWWSPYVAVSGSLTLAGMGATTGPDFSFSIGGSPVASRGMFDRLVGAEAGIQASSRHWQGELGAAVVYGAPVDAPAFFGVLPSLTVRYFF